VKGTERRSKIENHLELHTSVPSKARKLGGEMAFGLFRVRDNKAQVDARVNIKGKQEAS
jgi:hypothetical protein